MLLYRSLSPLINPHDYETIWRHFLLPSTPTPSFDVAATYLSALSSCQHLQCSLWPCCSASSISCQALFSSCTSLVTPNYSYLPFLFEKDISIKFGGIRHGFDISAATEARDGFNYHSREHQTCGYCSCLIPCRRHVAPSTPLTNAHQAKDVNCKLLIYQIN